MKLQLLSSFTVFLFILFISCTEGTNKMIQYDMNNQENPYVMVQLKKQSGTLDSVDREKEIRSFVEQIKSTNTNLGFAPMEKKIASFNLEEQEGTTTYLAIRNFDDFKSAETYAQAVDKEITSNIYGDIKDPFPISQANYKRCVEEKDFESYYKYYSKSK